MAERVTAAVEKVGKLAVCWEAAAMAEGNPVEAAVPTEPAAGERPAALSEGIAVVVAASVTAAPSASSRT